MKKSDIDWGVEIDMTQEKKEKYQANKIFIHLENGINFVLIDDVEVRNVEHCEIKWCSDGLAEITIKIKAETPVAMEFEALTEKIRDS